MAFDAKLMQALGDRNIALWVSCYEKEGDDDDENDGGNDDEDDE